MRKKFELRTYHSSLKYLFDHPTLNFMQASWLEFLCEFDFEIKHIKGKENKVFDAFMIKIHATYVTAIIIFQSNLKQMVVDYLAEDGQSV